MTDLLRCSKCGQDKPDEQFPWGSWRYASRRGRHSWCRQCANTARRVGGEQGDTTQRYHRAYTAASRRLREAHPDEFAQLLDDALRNPSRGSAP